MITVKTLDVIQRINFFLGFCPFAKVFSREYEPYFEFAKVFSAKFVLKIAKSFCQIFRVFFDTRKLMPAKVSAPKVERDQIITVNDKQVVISGVAGSGKTTFVNKIVLDWAKGDFLNGKKTPYVGLLIPIRCKSSIKSLLIMKHLCLMSSNHCIQIYAFSLKKCTIILKNRF